MEKTNNYRATEFAVFCIENAASKLGCSGKEIYDELKRTNGIAHFLYPSYPTLHTQSKEYMIDELLQYIYQNNPEFRKGGRK